MALSRLCELALSQYGHSVSIVDLCRGTWKWVDYQRNCASAADGENKCEECGSYGEAYRECQEFLDDWWLQD